MQLQLEAQRRDLVASIRSQWAALAAEERHADPLDQVTAEANREDAGRSIERSRGALKNIEDTLERMKTGEYGQCLDCARPIAAKRLQACPLAARCVVCQDVYEQTPVN